VSNTALTKATVQSVIVLRFPLAASAHIAFFGVRRHLIENVRFNQLAIPDERMRRDERPLSSWYQQE
jgi:hypothetical protein